LDVVVVVLDVVWDVVCVVAIVWAIVVLVVVWDVVCVVLFQLLLEEIGGRGEDEFVSPDPIPSGEQGDVGEEVPVGPEIVFEVGIGRSVSKG
jgi:hypothetical protein